MSASGSDGESGGGSQRGCDRGDELDLAVGEVRARIAEQATDAPARAVHVERGPHLVLQALRTEQVVEADATDDLPVRRLRDPCHRWIAVGEDGEGMRLRAGVLALGEADGPLLGYRPGRVVGHSRHDHVLRVDRGPAGLLERDDPGNDLQCGQVELACVDPFRRQSRDLTPGGLRVRCPHGVQYPARPPAGNPRNQGILRPARPSCLGMGGGDRVFVACFDRHLHRPTCSKERP